MPHSVIAITGLPGNGGGLKEAKLHGGWGHYKFWLEVLRGKRSDAQLLCATCHELKSISERIYASK